MRPDIVWQIVSTGSLVALLLLSIWLSKRFGDHRAERLSPTTPGSLEQIGGGWDEIFRDHSKCREARREGFFDGACDDCRPVVVDHADG